MDKQRFEDVYYPERVDKVAGSNSEVNPSDKTNLVIFLIALGNVFGFLFFMNIFNRMGISLVFCFLFVLFLDFSLLFIYIRFFVYNESKREEERKTFQDDRFSSFYNISPEAVKVIRNKEICDINIFQYDTGEFLLPVIFKYGSNNRKRAINTSIYFEKMFKLLNDRNWTFTITRLKEDFKKSNEYSYYMDKVNKYKHRDKALEIFNYMLDNYVVHTNVSMDLLIVRGTNRSGSSEDLANFFNVLYKEYLSNDTAIRNVISPDTMYFQELVKHYYGIEAIDVTRLKSDESLSSDVVDFHKDVAVYSVTFVDGTVKEIKGTKDKIQRKMVSGLHELKK